MPAITPTPRKDSAQSTEERIAKISTQVDYVTKPQHNNVTAAAHGRADSSHAHVPTVFNTSFNVVAGPVSDTITAERRRLNRADPISNQDDESSPVLVPSSDIVTNDERAKSPSITRVLSPMRTRRTPVLINAPDVRCHINPRVRHIPSFNSVLSSSTSSGSEASTVRTIRFMPQDDVPSSSLRLSPAAVTSEEINPINFPLPPSPLPNEISNTVRYNESIEGPRQGRGYNLSRQPHFLSPVTEASSTFSIRSLGSSIVDLDADIVTAERRPVSDVKRHNVQTISPAHHSQVSLGSQQSRQTRFCERFSLDGGKFFTEGLRSGGQVDTPIICEADRNEEKKGSSHEEYEELRRRIQEKRRAKTVCGYIERLKKRMRRFRIRVEEGIARKMGMWAGLEWT